VAQHQQDKKVQQFQQGQHHRIRQAQVAVLLAQA
jgi:hypothetical protein